MENLGVRRPVVGSIAWLDAARSLVGKCYRKADLTVRCLGSEVEPDGRRNPNSSRLIPGRVDLQE